MSPAENMKTVQDAALAALRSLAVQRDAMPATRADLLAAAWWAGTRNVAELAREADVSRDIVYSDLRARGVEPTDRAVGETVARPTALQAETVSRLADIASAMLLPAMLDQSLEPLTDMAWQTHIILVRVAEAARARDVSDQGALLRAVWDVIERTGMIRERAHRMLGDEIAPDALVKHMRDQSDLAIELDETIRCIDSVDTITEIAGHRTNLRVSRLGARVALASPRADGVEISPYANLSLNAALDQLGAALAIVLDSQEPA